MKTNYIKKSLAILAALTLAALISPNAHADSTRNFVPVKTEKQAAALTPGQLIAVHCGNCGGISVLKVDKEKSITHAYVCPTCHKEFHLKTVGESGKAHTTGSYVLVDSDGRFAHVAAAE